MTFVRRLISLFFRLSGFLFAAWPQVLFWEAYRGEHVSFGVIQALRELQEAIAHSVSYLPPLGDNLVP